MSGKIYLLLSALFLSGVIFTAFSGDDTDYPGGSPAGYTGSPGDGQDCHNCHGGSTAATTGILTSNIPPQGYTPGNTYSITVTVTGSGKKGFEASPQNTSGTQLGTLTAGSGNKLVGGGKYVTQSSSVSGSSATWTFSWTAPPAGTGHVTIYCAIAITKPVTKTTTLEIDEALTATASANPGQICNGSSSQLQASATGGGGTYTYLWTSDPPGFNSAQQNPAVTPVITTQYNVVVSDGTNSSTASTQVAVTDPPTADAGTDTTVSFTTSQVPVSGTAGNYSAVHWTTSGDGSFFDANTLNTTYALGIGDKTTGSVNLTLTALPNTPCTNSATSEKEVTISPSNGIQQQNGGSPILIQPNPTTGIFTIRHITFRNMEVQVEIHTITGMKVFTCNAKADGSGMIGPIGLSSNSKGIYFVTVTSGTRTSFAKLIVQ